MKRGVNVNSMKKEDMVSLISQHEDFTAVEFYLLSRGHHCLFIHQYHCELNPIERVCAKKYTRAYCNYSITGLRKTMIPGL